jgi:hypothetical protein
LRSPITDEKELQAAAGQIVSLTVKVLSGYNLNGDLAIHTVRAFRSMVHGFSSLEQRGGFGLPLDLEQSFDYLLDVFISGIHMKAAI